VAWSVALFAMTMLQTSRTAPKSEKRLLPGAIELSSIGVGYQVQDELLKAAQVEILVARTICSGKYLIIFSGGVSDVRSAIDAGTRVAGEALIDQLVLPTVHKTVFPALTQSVVLEEKHVQALGIIEAFSGVAIIAAADAAAKAANIKLFRIHVAMALGGKGFCLMTGTLADVTAGVNAAAEEVRKRGLLVSDIVIPQPSRELFAEYV
jgi:microcompartment protein CcmL/EutN